MIGVIPPDTPVISPPVPTEMAVDELLQVPPPIELLKVVAAPTQMFRMPVIVADTGFTVTVIVDAQPEEIKE